MLDAAHSAGIAWAGVWLAALACSCGARTPLLELDQSPKDAGFDTTITDSGLVDVQLDQGDKSEVIDTSTCLLIGAACTTSSQCCQGSCVAGFCALPQPLCVAGQQPVVVATGPSPVAIYAIAVDDTYIYWGSEDGAVLRAPKAGGEATTIASGLSMLYGLALDSTSVFAGSSTGIVKINKTLPGSTVLSPPEGNPISLAVDELSVFWTTHEGGTVRSVPKSGGTNTILATDLVHPLWIALDPSFAYVTDNIGEQILKIPKSGGSPLSLAVTSPTPWGIALDDSRVYWTNACGPDCGSVSVVDKNGDNRTAIATGRHSPLGIVVDELNAYWMEFNSSSPELLKMPKTGGSVLHLAYSNSEGCYVPAIDASCVYWVDAGGRVLRTAK